ncbi:MAG: flagellar protein FliS [Thermaerobacter sp.]|nr:flagellar protein FliS [Thermaerobacter sp.]
MATVTTRTNEAELARWREMSVRTLSPQGLVVFALEGVLRRVGLAEAALGSVALEDAHVALTESQDALVAVAGSLNPGWPPTANLRRLLDYCVRRLRDSNWQKDPAPLAEVTAVLSELADAFRQMGQGAAVPGPETEAAPRRTVDFAG